MSKIKLALAALLLSTSANAETIIIKVDFGV